ncbi:MAG: hypothetical protein HZC54_03990 [Verrucomicrobia bacterium]|nr:hypothetical protein [Verrucomicrobiota bacterium]
MPYDANWPQYGDDLTSVRLRGQWNGLKALIDAIAGGIPGPAGEVTAQQLADAIATGPRQRRVQQLRQHQRRRDARHHRHHRPGLTGSSQQAQRTDHRAEAMRKQ